MDEFGGVQNCWICPGCDELNDEEEAPIKCKKCGKGRFEAMYQLARWDPIRNRFLKKDEDFAQEDVGDEGAQEEGAKEGQDGAKGAAGEEGDGEEIAGGGSVGDMGAENTGAEETGLEEEEEDSDDSIYS